MASFLDHMRITDANTRRTFRHLFLDDPSRPGQFDPSQPGYLVDLSLDATADTRGPDEPIERSFTTFTIDGVPQPLNVTLAERLAPLVAVTALSYAGRAITATATGHGFRTGQKVAVFGAVEPEFNGAFVISVIDADTFTFGLASPATRLATGALVVRLQDDPGLVVRRLSAAGTGVTADCPGHRFRDGSVVMISGATPREYNGAFTIATPSPDTFTYRLAAAPAGTATGTVVAASPAPVVRAALQQTFRFSADIAQWTHHYLKYAATEYAREPQDASNIERFQEAAATALYFFPEVEDPPGIRTVTPARWRLPERLGWWFLSPSDKIRDPKDKPTDYGVYGPSHDDQFSESHPHPDYLRTGQSREGIIRPICALGALYHANPSDATLRDAIRRVMQSVLGNLKANGYLQYEGPCSRVSFSITTQVATLLPAPFNAVIPQSRQIDGLKGGDALMVYTALRVGAAVDPAVWGPDAAQYFASHQNDFRVTSQAVFFELYQAQKGEPDSLLQTLGIAAGAGAGIGALLSFVLPVIPFIGPFVAPVAAVAGAVAGVAVAATALAAIDFLRHDKLYETAALESDLCDTLVLLEPAANPGARELWDRKFYQMMFLNHRKVDALLSAYYARTDSGRAILSTRLADVQAQLALLRVKKKKSKKSWLSKIFSKKRFKKYLKAQAAYARAKEAYKWFAFVQNIVGGVPHRLLWAKYGRHYVTLIPSYVPGQPQTLGGIRTKVDAVNLDLPQTFGDANVGLRILDKAPYPAGFPESKYWMDLTREQQHDQVPEPQYWIHRTSVLKHNPYKYPERNPNTGLYDSGSIQFTGSGEGLLAFAIMRRLERDLSIKIF